MTQIIPHTSCPMFNAIRNEFKDIPQNNLLIGLVAKCYLGQTYDVHTLDMSGSILIHYM